MAMRDVDRLKKEAAKLTAVEQRTLARDLLKMANSDKNEPKSNINSLAGSIVLDRDPLDIQHEMRAEWP